LHHDGALPFGEYASLTNLCLDDVFTIIEDRFMDGGFETLESKSGDKVGRPAREVGNKVNENFAMLIEVALMPVEDSADLVVILLRSSVTSSLPRQCQSQRSQVGICRYTASLSGEDCALAVKPSGSAFQHIFVLLSRPSSRRYRSLKKS
jgi:hypothetical protein